MDIDRGKQRRWAAAQTNQVGPLLIFLSNGQFYFWKFNDSRLLALPSDLLKVLLTSEYVGLNIYDIIMIRSSCKSLFNIVADLHLFPKNFIHNHNASAKYFISLGSISCLKYLKSLKVFFTSDLAATAVDHDQFEVLKFLRNNGCAFDFNTAIAAAKLGKIDVMEYVLENGGDNRSTANRSFDADVCRQAAHSGHLDMLKYLNSRGFQWAKQVWSFAVHKNPIDVVKFALEQRCPIDQRTTITLQSIEMMEFFEDRRLQWKQHACESAVLKHDVAMLQWAHEHGAPWNSSAHSAVCYGHLDCVKYMHEQGASFNFEVVQVGSLEVLQFLVDNTDAKITPYTYKFAIQNMKRDVLQYLVKLKIRRPHNSLGILAAQTRNFEFFKFCIEELKFGLETLEPGEYEGIPRDIIDVALSGRNFDLFKYVIANNLHPDPKQKLSQYYVESHIGHWSTSNIYQFIYDMVPFEVTTRLKDTAIGTGGVEVLEWMVQKGAVFADQNFTVYHQELPTIAYLLKLGAKLSIRDVLSFKYAYEHGLREENSVTNAIERDNVELLRYLVHIGLVKPDQGLYNLAQKQKSPECQRYLEVYNTGVMSQLKSKASGLWNSVFK